MINGNIRENGYGLTFGSEWEFLASDLRFLKFFKMFLNGLTSDHLRNSPAYLKEFDAQNRNSDKIELLPFCR